MMNKLVFSDLDGTLIDFSTYDHSVSFPAVQKIQDSGIPLIFCSSKTTAEQLHFRKLFQNQHPFIVENGSAIVIPSGYFKHVAFPAATEGYEVNVLGKSRAVIWQALNECASQYNVPFKSYLNSELTEISKVTGLSPEHAQLAAQRDYSETVLKADFSSDSFQNMTKCLHSKGLAAQHGGKFVTVISKESNKGRAVKELIGLFKKEFGARFESFAIGDSQNDASMLNAVDNPYLVKKPGKVWDDITIKGLEKIDSTGPEAWGAFAEKLEKSI